MTSLARIALGTLALLAVLAGCGEARIGKLNEKAERLRLEQRIAAAQAGDPEAAFEVGRALCCEPGDGKDNRAATDWLCRAAVAGYGPAAHKLGQIYSGFPAEGLRLPDDLQPALAPAPQQPEMAYVWLKIAEGQGAPGAAEDAGLLLARMSELQRTRARAIIESDRVLACRWNEVFARQ